MTKTYTETEIRDMQRAALRLVETFDDEDEEIWQGVLEYYQTDEYVDPESLAAYDEPKPSIFSDDFREALRKTHEFFQCINRYIDARRLLDDTFKRIEYPQYARSVDLHGDSVDWEWRQDDRCGDYDYLRRSFPIAHLWAENMEDAIKAEFAEKESIATKAARADEEKKRLAKEAEDKKLLKELLNEYPDEVVR